MMGLFDTHITSVTDGWTDRERMAIVHTVLPVSVNIHRLYAYESSEANSSKTFNNQ